MLNSIASVVIAYLILGPLLAPGYSFNRTGELGNAVLPIILGGNIHLGVILAVVAVPGGLVAALPEHPRVRDPEPSAPTPAPPATRGCGRPS